MPVQYRINLFFAGFISYTLGYTATVVPGVNFIIVQAFQLMGLGVLIPAAVMLFEFRLESNYLKITLLLYMIWMVAIICRGFGMQYDFLKLMLFDPSVGIFLYLTPLIVLFPDKLIFYRKAFDAILIMAVTFVIFDAALLKYLMDGDVESVESREILEAICKNLAIPCGFLLLSYTYHTNTKKLFALGVIAVTFVLAILRARRGLMFMSGSLLMAFYLMSMYVNRTRPAYILYSLLAIFILTVTGFVLFFANTGGIFDSLMGRIDEDTRSTVEICFDQDMTQTDWWIGKGINGEYFCPGIDAPDADYRTVVETGYLNIILKGGFISLGLLLLTLLPAVYKGFFKSKNLLSKAAATWILLWMCYAHPSTITSFSMNYILVWVSVSICYSYKIRNMKDVQIKKYFTSYKSTRIL
ncbi:MAG TPA: hypothetical protein VK541_03115 [Pedobacter sp.]|uniref:hypothetical protein n=1 Tax=Pedobacter sp. TaxID=1411316 RepID=UPI002C637187|nr:hypothetical protein [Pedobacter sp.]HMI01441.1 hypothetical protein [Pedobacter sp.]